MKKLNILAIIGTTKSKSSTLSIVQQIQKRYNEKVEIGIYNRLADLPHFNPDLEDHLPSEVAELRSLITAADGLIFCTPEYVFSLPASLKNLIEWNVSTVLFSRKPVAMIVAAASGQKAYESLDLILTTLEVSMPDESKVLIQGARGKLKEDGSIQDQEILTSLDTLIGSLLDTISHSDRKATKYL